MNRLTLWPVIGTGFLAAAATAWRSADRPVAAMLAWLAAAGFVALVVTSGQLRRLLAVATAVAALGALIATLADRSAIVVLPAATSALALAAAVIAVLRAPAWPGWGSRYERAAPTTAASDATPLDLWKSQDRGEDPTA